MKGINEELQFSLALRWEEAPVRFGEAQQRSQSGDREIN